MVFLRSMNANTSFIRLPASMNGRCSSASNVSYFAGNPYSTSSAATVLIIAWIPPTSGSLLSRIIVFCHFPASEEVVSGTDSSSPLPSPHPFSWSIIQISRTFSFCQNSRNSLFTSGNESAKEDRTHPNTPQTQPYTPIPHPSAHHPTWAKHEIESKFFSMA